MIDMILIKHHARNLWHVRLAAVRAAPLFLQPAADAAFAKDVAAAHRHRGV